MFDIKLLPNYGIWVHPREIQVKYNGSIAEYSHLDFQLTEGYVFVVSLFLMKLVSHQYQKKVFSYLILLSTMSQTLNGNSILVE